MAIVTIADRYVLDPGPPRTGGTGHVHRAQIHGGNGEAVAVKVYDGEALDDETQKEVYLRERSALQTLVHPRVVRLIDAGRDPDSGQYYVAMEWLEDDLLTHLKRSDSEAVSWEVFAPTVLRPLLEGLSAAHARRLVHRDIKPANIMVDVAGEVKLTDFGISKLIDSVRLGMTVSDFRSRPYAAPERDTDGSGLRGDLYSLGVTVIDLLGGLGSRPAPDADPRHLLDALSLPDDARGYLSDLIEVDPLKRPYSAKVALTDLNRILTWESPPELSAPTPTLSLVLTRNVIERARALLDADSEAKARKLVQADLWSEDGPPSLGLDDREGMSLDREEHSIALNLVGAELLYGARFDRNGSGAVILTSVSVVPPSLLERRREQALELEHELQFEGRAPNQRSVADRLIQALSEHAAELAAESLGREESELLERWRSVLVAKSELESRREDPLPYSSWKREDRVVTFEIQQEVGERYLDQVRRVPIPGGGAVVGEVIEAGEGEIGLAVQKGDIEALPSRAKLFIDRGPSRRAIQRQKQALNALHDGSAARQDLARLLSSPVDVEPLVPVQSGPFRQDLDRPKQDAVEAALASPDFTLVQGPPGTGKTTFIVELIVQLLASRPEARVLLSSQTHVAVDNAVTKLAELAELRIVRVGRAERIDPNAASLTPERQLVLWRQEASSRAKAWLRNWGLGRGISPEALGAYSVAAELRVDEQERERLRTRIANLEQEAARLVGMAEDPLRGAPSPTSSGEMLSDVEDELVAVQDELELRHAEFDQIEAGLEGHRVRAGEYLGLSSTVSLSELDRLLEEQFSVDPDDLARYRRLAELQDEWLTRFGQSADFTEALIARAQVVAGTCVGLAGTLGEAGHFDLAIVDEVSKATPTEALVPMIRSKRWVLVGDERQLPPFVDSGLVDQELLEENGLQRADLEETMFTQLAPTLPADRHRVLSTQHRMLRPIGNLISECFYGGALDSSRGSVSELRCLGETFPAPVTWYSTVRLTGKTEQRLGTTFWNEAELKEIRRLLTRLQGSASTNDERLEVAVITGYGEQARRLQRDLRPNDPRWANLDLHVHPVDSFQGQERDLVIYSVTRCNERNDLGFLRSERRINVALSRARDGLVIVGDHQFCAHADEGVNPFADVLDKIGTLDGCELKVLTG
jgi:serine/threonine protein kinase